MRKKKKGSSLVLVLVIFLMLITVGTAIVSTTSVVYKNQINESKRAQNLYSSESGLDVTYNVIAKTIETAISLSNKAVNELLYKNYNLIEVEREAVKNGTELKFPVKIGDNSKSRIIKSDLTLNREELKKVEDEIFQTAFCLIMKDNITKCITNGEYLKSITSFTEYFIKSEMSVNGSKINEPEKIFSKIKYENDISPNIIAEIIGEMPNLDDEDKEIELDITSQFYSGIEDDENKNITRKNTVDTELTAQPGKQERVINLKYKITVPVYNPTNTTKKVQIIKRPVFDNSFAIDGNLYLSGSQIDIEGNLYVKGSDIKETDVNGLDQNVFNKYKNGIIIESNGNSIQDSTNVNIEGNIVTTKSISMRDYTNLIMNGDIYASNLHLGKYTNEANASNNIGTDITINRNVSVNKKANVYLSNDLSIYADNSTVNLNSFYGLNDITDNSSGQDRSSSSIIINSRDNVNLYVKEKVYILGTAYINTDNKYQTGESVAVKGNYLAYTTSLEGQEIGDSNTNYENVEFQYDRPLQLISKINGADVNVISKAQYFEDYSKIEENKERLNLVSVSLPSDTYSIGAYINGNTIKGSSGKLADTMLNIIKTEKDKFAKKVYGFGIIGADFDNPPTSVETGLRSVTTELLLENLPNVYNEMIAPNDYRVVFNKEKNKNVVLVGNDSNVRIDELKSDTNNIVIDLSNNNEAKFTGLIMTNGNVEIYGQLEVRGSIIAAGNLVCNSDNKKKKFIYDSKVVKEIIAIYYDKLYKEGSNDTVIVKPTDEYTETVEIEYDSSKQHNVKDYIKQSLWSIKK